MTNPELIAALADWRKLNTLLSKLTETEIAYALELECKSPMPREYVVRRLHERLSTVKSKRERTELLNQLFGAKK